MRRPFRAPRGWITLSDVAAVNELCHYRRLVVRLCGRVRRRGEPRLRPLRVRRFRGVLCIRYWDLHELQCRIDRWRSGRPWTRFARWTRRRHREAS